MDNKKRRVAIGRVKERAAKLPEVQPTSDELRAIAAGRRAFAARKTFALSKRAP